MHKLLYISLYRPLEGVENKINTQISALEKHDFEIKKIYLEEIGEVSSILNLKPLRKIKRFFNLKNAFKQLDKIITTYRPDLIYSRNIIYIPGMMSVLKKTKYVTEVNSDDVEDMKLKSGRLANWYNRTFRKHFLNSASGFVFISRELKDSDSYKNFQQKYMVVGNGIHVPESLPEDQLKNVKKEKLKFLLIASSIHHYWNGFDKVIQLANHFPESEFLIVGPTKQEILKFYPNANNCKNLKVLGRIPHDELKSVIEDCDVGLSTLALHRKNMEEASPLKSRQYLAQGKPIIIGYTDTDFKEPFPPFILNIGNTEDNVQSNIEVIETFVKQLDKVNRKDILTFAQQHLDAGVKNKARAEFFRSIINN